MAGKSASILVKIIGDESGLAKSLRAAEDKVGGFGDKVGNIGTKLMGVGAGMTAAVTLPIAAMGVASIKAFGEAEQAQAQLDASLRSTGATAWTSSAQIDALASSMQDKLAIDGDLVKSGASVLLTFTQVQNKAGEGNDIFDRATLAAADLSTKMGTDLVSANMLVGKALNDPIRGMTALRRAGVQLTDAQAQQVEQFVAVGDVASAQKIILAELETQFGGSAKAAADTSQGGLEKLRLKFEDLQESVGERLIPIMDKLGTGLEAGLDVWDRLGSSGQNVALVIGGIAAAAGPATFLVGGLMKTVQLGTTAVGAAVGAWQSLSFMISSVGQVAATQGVSNLTALRNITSQSISSMTGLGKATVIAGGALAGLAAIQIGDAIRKNVVGEADRISTAMKDMTIAARGGTEEVLAAFSELAGAQPDNFFTEIPQVFGKNLRIMPDLAKETIEDIEAAFESLSIGDQKAVLDALRAYGDGLARGSQEAKDNAELIDNLSARYDRNTAAAEATADANAGAAAGIEGVGEAAEETGDQMESAAPGFDSFLAQLSASSELATGLSSALDELFGPKLGLEAATSAWEEALDSLTSSLAENGATLDITTEKGRANREQLVSNTEASFDLMEAEIASGVAADEAAARHKMRTENLIREAVQSGLTEAEVRSLIGTYGDVPDDVITRAQFQSIQAMLDAKNLTAAARIYGAMTPAARAAFEKSAAEEDVRALQRELDRLDGRNVTASVSLRLDDAAYRRLVEVRAGFRAMGGPVRKGQPYIVGEREPELFVPDQDGQILNQQQMRAATANVSPFTGAAAAAAPVHLHLHLEGAVIAGPDVERWLVTTVEAAAARGSQFPKLRRTLAG